jgi:hypothetical protein
MLNTAAAAAPAAAAAEGNGSAEAAVRVAMDKAAFPEINALLTTTIKAAAGFVNGACSSNQSHATDYVLNVSPIMSAAAAACAAVAADHGDAARLLATQGRCLSLFGRSMAAFATTVVAAAASPEPPHGLSNDTRCVMATLCAQLLGSGSSCVSYLAHGLAAVQLPGEASAAAAAKVQLQQQAGAVQQQLLQHLHIATHVPTTASRASIQQPGQLLRAAFSSELCQVMVELGEAGVVQLPSKHCCNSPRCSNLGGLSEQQLAGKGSVCSRCRSAR